MFHYFYFPKGRRKDCLYSQVKQMLPPVPTQRLDVSRKKMLRFLSDFCLSYTCLCKCTSSVLLHLAIQMDPGNQVRLWFWRSYASLLCRAGVWNYQYFYREVLQALKGWRTSFILERRVPRRPITEIIKLLVVSFDKDKLLGNLYFYLRCNSILCSISNSI